MHIAILSDTHGRVATAERALAAVRDRGIATVLHCGDIDEPSAVAPFAGFDAHFVFGNCDGDRDGIRRAIEATNLRLHEPFGHLELDGVRLAFVHGDDGELLRSLENSGHFHYVFYGHTHQAREHRAGATRVINPGALHRARPKTFLVLDLATGETESVVVDEVH